MKTALLALPTVHINGTSSKYPLQVDRAVLAAVQEAYRRIQQAAPHSRDFYVQAKSAEAWKQAHAEHVARLVEGAEGTGGHLPACYRQRQGCLKVGLISNGGCPEAGSTWTRSR
jgi:tryptophan 2,3-dioxygenase